MKPPASTAGYPGPQFALESVLPRQLTHLPQVPVIDLDPNLRILQGRGYLRLLGEDRTGGLRLCH